MSYLYFVSTNLRTVTVEAQNDDFAKSKMVAVLQDGETITQIRQLFPIDVV